MPDPKSKSDDWEPPSLKELYKLALDFDSKTPLDLKPYQPVLTPLDIPPYKPRTDHSSDVPHWAPGSGRPWMI